MPRIPLLMASLGLAVNVLLWSVPLLVAGSALPAALPPALGSAVGPALGADHALGDTPSLSEALASAERGAGPVPGVPDAFVQLVGAEAEAMTVAGQALQQPDRPDLGPRATHAGARVEQAMHTYIASVAAALDRHADR